MSEFGRFRELMGSGYEAIEGIKADESLNPDEKSALIHLDPTIERVQNEIADIFALEEAEAKRVRNALENEQGRSQ